LLKPEFTDVVAEVWSKENKGDTPIQVWQNKMRRLRQYLRGWAKNIKGKNKKEKERLMALANDLDLKAEHAVLTQQECELKQKTKERLNTLLREEEIYWSQRAKSIDILEGDSNTRYFQLVANGKRRKTRIFRLEQEEGIIEGEENLKKYITKYYKGLFGAEKSNSFTLNEEMIEDIPQVSQEENEILTENFTEKEVREAIFQMKHNKAPGPDGFPIEFYQLFWNLIKDDLMAMFREFHDGHLPSSHLNYGVISLIPKLDEVKMIQRYRPLCMLNVSFKIFTKVLANRFTAVANRIIKPTQTAFLPGRYIMEGIVILHETLHEILYETYVVLLIIM
jgi:hypothetical protein